MANLPDPAISVRNVDKYYAYHTRGLNPVKRLAGMVRRFTQADETRGTYALRDISLDIRKGESVALIGLNGSGKSTLLRIISGVTSPTRGTLTVSGRLGGVVDLGAGFHGDLTGYENIFLQGRILGYDRRQIFQKLPEIEAFSELGDFLNTPVRHFSAGMFLRLAFSLAVCSEPEILIVDEALAVGDAYFQWKCIQKIDAMKAAGVTLLFVSHAPDAAVAMCQRSIWLHQGTLRGDGPSGEVIQDYNRFMFRGMFDGEPSGARHEISAFMHYSRFGSGGASIRNVRYLDRAGNETKSVRSGDSLTIECEIDCQRRPGPATLYLMLELPGQPVSYFRSADRGMEIRLRDGINVARMELPDIPLREGIYYATIAVGDISDVTEVYDCHQKAYSFTVTEAEGRTQERFSSRFATLRPKVTVKAGQNA